MMQRREMREQREKMIVDTAIRLLSQQGFLGVRMADIARETQNSMGTIYSHFESKEDLLVACAHTLAEEERELFSRIGVLPIPAIEKIISVMHCSWYISANRPDLIEIENLSLMPLVWRRATEHRIDALNQMHVSLAETFFGIVLEAIDEDLNGYSNYGQEEIEALANHLTHGMWGLCVGLSSTVQSGYASTLCPNKDSDHYRHFVINYANFLKGYGWQEADPEVVFERCRDSAMQCLEGLERLGAGVNE